MEIRSIEVDTDYFYQICDYLEKNINRENLYRNGGTLKYTNLTYNSHILFVAFDNDIPVGYNSIWKNLEGYYVAQIAVKKEYQNKGIGTLMMQKIIEIAESENKYITAHVMNYNTASQKMFLGLGFEKIREDEVTGNGFYILDQREKIKSR